MENNKQTVNKLELLLRAMAKAQGIDPDQPDQSKIGRVSSTNLVLPLE